MTDYLIDDENYYMGEERKQILYNSEDIENEVVNKNYIIAEEVEVSEGATYENQSARAVLLVKKSN